MRAGKAAFCGNLGGLVAEHMIDELFFDLPCLRERVGDRGNRFVHAGEHLLRCNVGVDGSGGFQQLAAVICAVADDLRADMRHTQREILP